MTEFEVVSYNTVKYKGSTIKLFYEPGYEGQVSFEIIDGNGGSGGGYRDTTKALAVAKRMIDGTYSW